MIVEVLAADAVTMSVCIISPAEDTCIRDVGREEMVEPVDAVFCCPGPVAMSIQSMDGNNTGMESEQALAKMGSDILYGWLLSLRHHLKT